MKKAFRMNIQNPTTGINCVGFGYRISDISFNVKTLTGTYEVLEDEAKFFESKSLTPKW